MSLSPPVLFLSSFLVGVILGLVFLAISRLATPPRRLGDKTVAYESGVKPLPSRLRYFAMHYFPYIVLYVAFDLFTAYIVSTLYYGYSYSVLVALLLFSLVVFLGLVAALATRLVN